MLWVLFELRQVKRDHCSLLPSLLSFIKRLILRTKTYIWNGKKICAYDGIENTFSKRANIFLKTQSFDNCSYFWFLILLRNIFKTVYKFWK